MPRAAPLIAPLLLAALLAGQSAVAGGMPPPGRDILLAGANGPEREHRQDIGKHRAAQIVRRQLGGRILKVESVNGRYRVKLLKDSGHIKTVWVDASSGKILGR